MRATLPSGDRNRVRADMERVAPACKPGGGFIFCTGHTVHEDCLVDDVRFAYELVTNVGTS